MPPARMRGDGRKAKNPKKTLLRLLSYLKKYTPTLIIVMLCVFATAFAQITGSTALGDLVDDFILPMVATGSADFAPLTRFVVKIGCIFAVGVVASFFQSYLMVSVTQGIQKNVRDEMFRKMQTLPLRYFDSNTAGNIMSRYTSDIDTLRQMISQSIPQAVSAVVTLVVILVTMLTESWILTIVSLITVMAVVFSTKFLAGKSAKFFIGQQKSLGAVNGYIEEMISGQKTLRAYTQEERVIGEMAVQNKRLVDEYFKTDYYATIMGPGTNATNNLALALVSIFGAILFLRGEIDIGGISAFVLYSRKFTGPIREVAEIYGELQSSLAAAERVFKVMDENPEPADTANAVVLPVEEGGVEGNVELQNVNFGYTKDKVILKDFSMKAPKGSLIAIVGPTGAGKTTFINLLMRFYDIDSGKILVDGLSSTDITRKSLRLSYSMVLQDTWLFYGTIYENIAYGRPEATREEVVAAAKAAHIHHYIESLPQGYDTLLIDDGTNISKGQKQLLTIARALLMKTPMLILDEATSNVDTRTEHQIQAAMRTLMEDKTCFVVAHRLSTIRNADCILVVRDGNVVERGNHEELMKLRGFYYEMHQAQYQ